MEKSPVGADKISTGTASGERRGGVVCKNEKSNGELSPEVWGGLLRRERMSRGMNKLLSLRGNE